LLNPLGAPFSFETPKQLPHTIDEAVDSGIKDEPKDTFLSLDEEWELDPETSVADMLKFIKEGRGTKIVAATPAEKGGEWHIIRSGGDRPDLKHHSDNPYDFIPSTKFEALIDYWRNPKQPCNLTNDEK